MIKSLFLCLFSIFFIYGLISFIFTAKNPSSTYIIKTLNNEKSIEVKLRIALIQKKKIIVIDLGSTDETTKIVKKMAQDYPSITLIEKEQCF